MERGQESCRRDRRKKLNKDGTKKKNAEDQKVF